MSVGLQYENAPCEQHGGSRVIPGAEDRTAREKDSARWSNQGELTFAERNRAFADLLLEIERSRRQQPVSKTQLRKANKSAHQARLAGNGTRQQFQPA